VIGLRLLNSNKAAAIFMNLKEAMKSLASKASPSTKRTLLRHGAVEPLFGVRIGDMKPLVKQLKGNQDLALELYATRNSDAMYLAGLIGDGSQMTRKQLDKWAASATWHMISGCSVAWVAAEHPQGFDAAMKWIDSRKELVAVAGWSTLSALVTTIRDEQLPMKKLEALLGRCAKMIHQVPDRVLYTMNNFLIACGTYAQPLADKAIETARKIGAINIDMGDTACQVPDAESYIIKSRRGLPVAPKRKSVRC
jgi:3-methyladenine DNA glycosylase AlkD